MVACWSGWVGRFDQLLWVVRSVRPYSRYGKEPAGLIGGFDHPLVLAESRKICRFRFVKWFSCRTRPSHSLNIRGCGRLLLIAQTNTHFYILLSSNPSFSNPLLSLLRLCDILWCSEWHADLGTTLGLHRPWNGLDLIRYPIGLWCLVFPVLGACWIWDTHLLFWSNKNGFVRLEVSFCWSILPATSPTPPRHFFSPATGANGHMVKAMLALLSISLYIGSGLSSQCGN